MFNILFEVFFEKSFDNFVLYFVLYFVRLFSNSKVIILITFEDKLEGKWRMAVSKLAAPLASTEWPL